MFAVGLWLAITRPRTEVRVLGGVIAALGLAPALLWLLFLFYLLFYSD